jgi:hypothetical protein
MPVLWAFLCIFRPEMGDWPISVQIGSIAAVWHSKSRGGRIARACPSAIAAPMAFSASEMACGDVVRALLSKHGHAPRCWHRLFFLTGGRFPQKRTLTGNWPRRSASTLGLQILGFGTRCRGQPNSGGRLRLQCYSHDHSRA